MTTIKDVTTINDGFIQRLKAFLTKLNSIIMAKKSKSIKVDSKGTELTKAEEKLKNPFEEVKKVVTVDDRNAVDRANAEASERIEDGKKLNLNEKEEGWEIVQSKIVERQHRRLKLLERIAKGRK